MKKSFNEDAVKRFASPDLERGVIDIIKQKFTCRDIASMFGKTLRQGTQRCILDGHEDKNPSAEYKEFEDRYICYSKCNINWDLIDLYAHFGKIDNRTAIKELAEKAGISGNGKKREKSVPTFYDYQDEKGQLLYQLVITRFINEKGEKDKKTFCRRPDSNGDYIWNIKGVKRIIYKLYDLCRYFSKGSRLVFIPEGEKGVETLIEMGFPATCNPFGAGKWKDEYCSYFPKDAIIIILPDSDKPGTKHSRDIANSFISQGFENIKIIDLGYPVVEKHGKDIYDWFQEGHTPEELQKLVEKTPIFTGEEDEGNNDEINDDGIDYDSLQFPLECMPEAVKPLINQMTETMGIDPGIICVPLLTFLGSALGSKIEAEIHSGYKVKSNLFSAVISPPGSKKSPVIKIVMKPVVKKQTNDLEQYELKVEQSKEAWDKWKQEKDSLPKEKQNNFSEPEPVKLLKRDKPTYYLTNATTEGMIGCHALNPRGFINVYDELTALVNSMNQYKGGKGDDRQFILSLWSGGAISTVRKGREAANGIEYIHIPETCVSITGGLQPSTLEKIFDNKGKSGDGFAQRFLIAYPNYVRTFRKKEPTGISFLAESDYQDLFDSLFEYGETKRTLCLSPESYDLWIMGCNAMIKETFEGDLLEAEKETWDKLQEQAVKIALILHCCRIVSGENTPGVIDIESMSKAWKLINYFMANIRKAYRELSSKDEDKDNVKKIISVIKNSPGCKTTVREIQRKNPKWNSQFVKLLIKQMVEKDVLREIHQSRTNEYTFSEKYLRSG